MGRRGTRYSKDAEVNTSRKRLSILKRIFGFKHCMVEGCDYDKTFEIHRLVPGKEGGDYEVGNMFAICPNHHAEVSRGLISLEKLSDSELRVIEGSEG
jgi:predicted restriction endonuclease